MIGFVLQRLLLHAAGVWWQLVAAWLYLTPLWAALTAWLGADVLDAPVASPHLEADEGGPWRTLFRRSAALADEPVREPARWTPGCCGSRCARPAIGFVAALGYGESWTWLPLIVAVWGFAIAADVVERGVDATLAKLGGYLRRALAVVLVFHYVCLAWIFFRAPTFDAALGVLRQLARARDRSRERRSRCCTLALVAGFLCHFFADGSFRWLRDAVRARSPRRRRARRCCAAALVLRELSHTKIVPFIYFQF